MTFQLLIKVCVQLQVQTAIALYWMYVSSLDVLGTSAENITCNTTSTVSTPCSASVSRKRSAETDGDDDDHNENKTLGRALDPRANGTWLSKLTE